MRFIKSLSYPGLAVITAALLGSVWFGQFFRLDLFSQAAGGLLVSDAVLGMVVVWALILAVRGRLRAKDDALTMAYLIWLIAVVVSFVVNMWSYETGQQLVAGAYLIRAAALFAVLPIATALYRDEWQRNLLGRYLAYLAGGLLALGAVLFVALPDFAPLVPLGWDPHQGRLTSTWLDPNYFGSFLALLFAVLLAFERLRRSVPKQLLYWLALVVLWVGMYLTFSRSALVTFAAAGLLVALLTSWRAVLTVVVLTGLVFVLPSRFQARVSEGISFVGGGNGAEEEEVQPDPTANARLVSWQKALDVYRLRPVVGVGYNFYPFAQVKVGNTSAEGVAENRSAAGSDSTLLTLLATTGIPGLLAFLAMFVIAWREFWRARKSSAWARAGLGVIAALAVSSAFNNTGLYTHIMIPSLMILGAAAAASRHARGA